MELAFERYGEQGSPLIILHGFMASARNWRSAAQELAKQHVVYVLDQRNHGASPQQGPLDYLTLADDVVRFMDGMGLVDAHVLGHSMGGKVGMCLALQQPQRLRSLIVADIAPVSYQHCFDRTLNALRTLSLTEIMNRKQAEMMLATEIPDLAYRQFLLQNLVLQQGQYSWRIDLDLAHRYAPYIVGFPDFPGMVAHIPCLFLAGEHSSYVQEEAVRRYFPVAEIQTIANAGHWLYVQAPTLFLQCVLNWLGNSPDF